jgi:hypothetical protein
MPDWQGGRSDYPQEQGRRAYQRLPFRQEGTEIAHYSTLFGAVEGGICLPGRFGFSDIAGVEADLVGPSCMTQINPLTGAVIQSTQVQPRQSAEKDRQIRRMQNLGKNTSLQGDRLEHEVESADALHRPDDGQGSHQEQRQQQHPQGKPSRDEGPPHIDLTA